MRHAICVLLIALGACSTDTGIAPTTARPPATATPAPVDGTVRFLNLEGGCWVIDTAQGRVEPLDLPKAFQVDGLAVRVSLSEKPGMMSACQAGSVKHVEAIEKR